MKTIKFVVAVLISALVSLTTLSPVTAARVFDFDKNRWVDADSVRKSGRSTSSIRRQIVDYDTKYRVGTVVVETSERRLYLVLEDGKAMKYGIGVGRDGFRWAGTHRITRKAEWPGWTPPPAMRKRVPGLPAYMPGGPENPLGARAMYIGSTLYRLHGTSEPWTIGQAVSSGCIRLTNEDVIDLYDRVKIGATVVVKR